MIHCVVGTAGHIDHGKTALVRALTGIDTDRLEEEKRRGISIDLGFAHLPLTADIECGFVDVPGHERFVRNMLAGVGGIDVVLLIVAADESIKPQTREHFDICRLLGIPRGIVVLTKADLVDADILELVRLEVEEFVAGSFLEGAPVVAVSSVTGAGLDTLKSELTKIAKQLPPKDATQHFRLPIDRAFSVKGFGAVVTGTLVAGTVRLEQEVEVHPLGRRVRVRGIQVHGSQVTKAVAGQRTALNLSGIDHNELHRGMSLSAAGLFTPAKLIDCALDLLPSAKPLKHRAPVHFHSGAAEIEAEVRLPSGTAAMKPGTSGWVRIVLRDPALLLPGDRFILRMFSPVVTIAGGRVLDSAPPRRFFTDRLGVLSEANVPARLALLVKEAKYGLSLTDLVARTGLVEKEIAKSVVQPSCVVLSEHAWVVDKAWWEKSAAALKAALSGYHKQNPLQPGMPKEDLRAKLVPGSPPFLLDALLKATAGLAVEGETIRLASHKLTLKGDEEQALAKIETAFRQAGLAVPGAQDVLKLSGVDPVRARTLLQMLLKDRKLVKVADDLLFHSDAITSLRGLLASKKSAKFTVPEFKDWTGVSRKYAIPLLEFLDRERVTRREGDARVVL